MAITKATASSVAPAAKGDLVVGSATNDAAVLAVGSNDQVLTADSSTATGLKWAAAGGGGMTQLASGSLSGASVSLTSISTAYNDLRLVVRNYIPVNDGQEFSLRINNLSSGYINAYNPGGQSNVGFTDDRLYGVQNDNTVSQSLIIWDFPDYANTTTWKLIDLFNIGNNATTTTNANIQMRMNAINTTNAITRIDIFPYTGNFTSGTYILYGVK